MQDLQPLAKVLIVLGIVITVIGLALLSGEKLGFLKYIGRLPGDISVEKENFKFYFPLATSLLLSIVLTFIFWLARKF